MIAGLGTLIHVLAEGRWFPTLLDAFPGGAIWFWHLWAYAFASYWHIGWIFVLGWLLAYTLLTRERIEPASFWLGLLMVSTAAGAMLLAVLPWSVIRQVEALAEGQPPALQAPFRAGAGAWTLLACTCVASWQLGRLLASRRFSYTGSSAIWVALWAIAMGILLWGLVVGEEHLIDVAGDVIIWSVWGMAAGVFWGWGRIRKNQRPQLADE